MLIKKLIGDKNYRRTIPKDVPLAQGNWHLQSIVVYMNLIGPFCACSRIFFYLCSFFIIWRHFLRSDPRKFNPVQNEAGSVGLLYSAISIPIFPQRRKKQTNKNPIACMQLICVPKYIGQWTLALMPYTGYILVCFFFFLIVFINNEETYYPRKI